MPVMYWAVLQAAENTLDVMSQLNSHVENITRITCPDGVVTDDTWEELYNCGWIGPHKACQTPFGTGYRVEPAAFAIHFLSIDLDNRLSSDQTHQVMLRAMRFDGEYVDLHSMGEFHFSLIRSPEQKLEHVATGVSDNGWRFVAPWIYAGWRRDGEYEISTYERVVQRDPAVIADIKRAVAARALW
jgi:hypothetical protein